jgi:HK97 family phage prohead protease
MGSTVTRKASTAEITAKAGASRTLRFICATDDIDRDGDIVLPGGLALDEYRKNPVFLFAHNFHTPPVGKAVHVGLAKAGKQLIADIEFADDGPDGFATRIYKLYKGGFLNAVSIGFKIIKAGPPNSSVYAARPDIAGSAQRVIYQATLLEISAVPIPSNPMALQTAVSKGLVTSQFVGQITDADRFAVEVLTELGKPKNAAIIAIATAVGVGARAVLARATKDRT